MVHNVLSCVQLKNEDVKMGISLCIPSLRTRSALIFWQYKDSVQRKLVPLRFDAAKEVNTFKIEWRPDYIAW